MRPTRRRNALVFAEYAVQYEHTTSRHTRIIDALAEFIDDAELDIWPWRNGIPMLGVSCTTVRWKYAKSLRLRTKYDDHSYVKQPLPRSRLYNVVRTADTGMPTRTPIAAIASEISLKKTLGIIQMCRNTSTRNSKATFRPSQRSKGGGKARSLRDRAAALDHSNCVTEL